MPHATHVEKSREDGLVALRVSVHSDKVMLSGDEVFIRTSADGVIKVPKSLLRGGEESGYVVFEAWVPGDVAAAVRSICAELFRLTCTGEDDRTAGDPACE
jgi:hypothetical protein